MRNKVGLHGNGEWTGIEDLVAYEIQNTVKYGVALVIFIGPSNDQSLRLKWHNFAKNSSVLGGKYRKMKDKWDPMIKSITIANPRDTYVSDEEYILTILDGVKDFFDTRFIDVEDAFRNAPDDLEDEVFTKVEDLKNKANFYFKEIDFESSLTNKKYHGSTNDDGTLKIVDLSTNLEVPSNANPSKRAIVGQAIIDLGGTTDQDETLYQRYNKLAKMILGDKAEEPKYSIESYLENKNEEMKKLHNELYSKVKERLSEVYEEATPNYISLKNSNGKNICEFHLQKNKVLIQTRVPEDETLLIGEKVPDSFLWALNYRVYVDENTDKDVVANILISAYNQIK